MKTWVRKTLSVGVLAAGALLLAPGAAHADVDQHSWDNTGVLNGTQLVAPVNIPVNAVGNAIGVAGESNSRGAGVNHIESGKDRNRDRGGDVDQNSWDNTGVLNGTQAYIPVNVPINVVGNAVGALFGEADAAGVGVNQIGGGKGKKHESAQTESGWHGGDDDADQDSWDNTGVLNGTQIYAPIDIPVNACGNSLSLLFGEADGNAFCWNSTGRGKNRTEGVNQNTSDNTGIANGTQLYAPINLPVNLSGNGISALFGEADATAASANQIERNGRTGDLDQDTSDNTGLLNGTQIALPVNVPLNVCGNAAALLGGEADAGAACFNGLGGDRGKGHGHKDHDGDHDGDWDGDDGHHGDYDGDKGDKDDKDDYADDNGNHGDDKDDYLGDGDAADDDTSYGSDSAGDGGRKAPGKSVTEQTPVSGLTDDLGGLGGLGVLNTLR